MNETQHYELGTAFASLSQIRGHANRARSALKEQADDNVVVTMITFEHTWFPYQLKVSDLRRAIDLSVVQAEQRVRELGGTPP